MKVLTIKIYTKTLEKWFACSNRKLRIKRLSISSELFILLVLDISFIVWVNIKFLRNIVIIRNIGFVLLRWRDLNRIKVSIDCCLDYDESYLKIVSSIGIKFISFLHIETAYFHEFEYIFSILSLNEVNVHTSI